MGRGESTYPILIEAERFGIDDVTHFEDLASDGMAKRKLALHCQLFDDLTEAISGQIIDGERLDAFDSQLLQEALAEDEEIDERKRFLRQVACLLGGSRQVRKGSPTMHYAIRNFYGQLGLATAGLDPLVVRSEPSGTLHVRASVDILESLCGVRLHAGDETHMFGGFVNSPAACKECSALAAELPLDQPARVSALGLADEPAVGEVEEEQLVAKLSEWLKKRFIAQLSKEQAEISDLISPQPEQIKETVKLLGQMAAAEIQRRPFGERLDLLFQVDEARAANRCAANPNDPPSGKREAQLIIRRAVFNSYRTRQRRWPSKQALGRTLAAKSPTHFAQMNPNLARQVSLAREHFPEALTEIVEGLQQLDEVHRDFRNNLFNEFYRPRGEIGINGPLWTQ